MYKKEIRIIEDDTIIGLEDKCDKLISKMSKLYSFADLLDNKIIYNGIHKTYVMVLTFDVSSNMTM